MRLAEAIRTDRVSPGQVSIWWPAPEQLAPVNLGGPSYTLGEIRATAAPAHHDVPGMLTEDAVGYLLDLGGVRLYHSGDTEYDHTMRAMAHANVDVMLVCIN